MRQALADLLRRPLICCRVIVAVENLCVEVPQKSIHLRSGLRVAENTVEVGNVLRQVNGGTTGTPGGGNSPS